MQLNATGKAKVFKNVRTGRNGQDYVNYASSLSRKNREGQWENASIEMKFKNGESPIFPTGATYLDIEITDGFLTFRKFMGNDEKEHTIFYVMVMEYRYDLPDFTPDDDIPW